MKIDIAFIIHDDEENFKNAQYVKKCILDFAGGLIKKKLLIPTMDRGFSMLGEGHIRFLIPKEWVGTFKQEGLIEDME